MTNQLTRLFETSLHHPRILGFGPLFNELRDYVDGPDISYPKYNIIKAGENDWVVEVAATGFSPNDLSVEVNGHVLSISGNSSIESAEDAEYVHRGIARRNFKLDLRLGEHVEVGEPVMNNGLLTIKVTRVIPPELAPRRLEIKTGI